MDSKNIIAVIGPSEELCNEEIYNFAFDLGKSLAEEGFVLATGGKKGIMEAVFKGAKSAKNYYYGQTIGIIPDADKKSANEYTDIVIATGIGTARNKILINTSDIVVAISGGAGTLSEIAFAWQMKKPLIAYTGFDGWAKNLAGKKIDNRNTQAIFKAKNINEIINILSTLIKNML